MGAFQSLIGKFSKNRSNNYIPVIINGSVSGSTNLRNNDIVCSIANCIATHVGKLQPNVIRKTKGKQEIIDDNINRLLSLRPNKEMTSFDFLYRLASDLVFTGNGFAWVIYDDDYLNINSILPVSVKSYSIFEDLTGRLFLQFQWSYNSKTYTVPYDDIIHIKSRFNDKRFIGTSPINEIGRSIDLLESTYKSIESTAKNNTYLRGYIKYNNFVDDDVLQAKVKEFKDAYMNAENSGGIAGIDESITFNSLQQQSIPIPAAQMALIRDNFYRYYNISENILMSKYSESEWNSFYESVIEPIALMLSQEFTYKLLTERERGFGNKIVFNANRLQYATLATRQSLAGFMYDRGMLTINEVREIMYFPLLDDGGDVRMISLNYIKAEDQSKYQVGETKPIEQSTNEQIERGDKNNENRGNNQSV